MGAPAGTVTCSRLLLGGLMHKADMESLADRIASMRFAVVLLAEVTQPRGSDFK